VKAAEVRDLTSEELVVKLEELKKDYLNLRFAQRTQQLEKPHELGRVRKTIARINTIVSEREKANDGKSSS